MQSLINDLLSFSKQAVSAADFKDVDLNMLLKEVIAGLEIEIEKTGADIQVAMLPVICAVPSLMHQLFHNLLSNALKFRKKSVTPAIKISAEKIKEANDRYAAFIHTNSIYYKITVADNGIGFDQAYAKDIFTVFKRLHSYHEYKGSGVGLSICKKIIETHNGFIIAESKVDEGSTFVIGLPQKPKTATHM